VHSTSSIFIQASREKIFSTVSQLLRWPEFLPHYRFVKQKESEAPSTEGRMRLHMSAEGGLFPVSWRAIFWADSSTQQLYFEHVAAFTKGMKVVWQLTPTPDGTLVEIHHELRFRIPVVGFLMEPLLQHGFIEPVAKKTLATFKRLLEANS
jgi:ribosome-associated toxin RatA of RatAB toxin-antitoxin module